MDHYFSGGGGGGDILKKKKCLQGLKTQNILFANTICIETIFAKKSDKLLKYLVRKLKQKLIKSNKFLI